MNKKEAINEMRNGKKVTHRWFSKNEWMTIEKGRILLEDGVRCDIDEFFSYRDNESWDNDYSIYKD